MPIIPLASSIAQECKEIAATYNRTAEPTSKLPLDIYSHWFESALPQASQRQQFFKKRILGKPISHANFRLAHLLSEKLLATLVVTPNFDDFLPRALTLFGIPHIVCDHPNTVERINPESGEIQIVHVHGTYWFYDGCNLRGEIEARTEDPRERSATMTSLLGNILSRHSALVIGYAGWEGDVIMTALKRRLQSSLPYNFYWFCYRKGDAEALPGWLKDNRDVRIVLPPAPPSKSESQPASEGKLAGIAMESEPTLTAQSVLDKLVDAFTEKSPALTSDPIGFFADQLKNSFPPDPSEKPSEDIYTLRDVIRRVELAREGEKKPTPIEGDIEKVRDAIRRAAYTDALQAASQVSPEGLNQDQREGLVDLVLSAALGLADSSQSKIDPEPEIGGYDLVLRLASGTAGKRPSVQRSIARALLNKGVTLSQLKRHEEAIQAEDQLLQRFGDAQDPLLRERVAKALRNKGLTLIDLSREEEAMQMFDQLVRRFGDATEPVIRGQVAKALMNKGFRLGQLNRSEEEIQVYEELQRRFGDATEPVIREQVAKALMNKGFRLGHLNRSEEEIQVYEELQRRFGDATEPILRELVATALLYKGLTLNTLKRPEEARLCFQEVLSRFTDSPDGAIQQLVKEAKAELKSLDKAKL